MTTGTNFDLADSIALLRRTPTMLNSLLRGLPDTWARRNEGEGTWSAYDIVGHLINGERTDWMTRIHLILEHGDTRPFDRIDRFAQFQESAGKSMEQLLDEFAAARAKSVSELESLNLQPADLAKPGKHPVLGPVTLANLIAAWPVHDLTHLHQMSRIMAHQYREAVGPWTVFMGVMQCSGHSAP